MIRASVAGLLLAASPAIAQDAAQDPACSNVRVAIPAELAAWSKQTPVAAGIKAGGGASVMPGQSLLVSLHPTGLVTLAPAAKDTNGHAGTLTLTVQDSGTYRVALGGRAWVDLVQEGGALPSTAHSHGPKCTGIRKMVDFTLKPGRYTIQLSGSQADSMPLLVAKVG
ncbi:homogentisate 1,2-dioxygenase [Sphingomonas sp.]|uniref:homogentisate 1,2-dioxygenase n=1 Tax=Sphingomonas sp. TaxID=28214 RepID=UPI002612F5C6|nr:homogentisate 1,2-dioxygenase [Sphingomonas sp.]MDF2493199.1 hypothetical protein [Sphingomonas sp.]